MGMFDWYKPKGVIHCPKCGTDLREWQGTAGACALFVWEQGARHPVDQLADDEDMRWSLDERQGFELPDTFEIYSHDCEKHRPIDAKCKCVNGVWTDIEVLAEPLPRGE